MSFLLRQLYVTLIVIAVIRCSQGFSIGYGTESDGPLEDGPYEEQYGVDKRWPVDYYYAYLPLTKRRQFPTRQKKFAAPRGKRISIDEPVTDGEDVRTADAEITEPYIKIGKRGTGYRPYMRVGRGPANDKTFLRIGRQPSDSTFLRIGRTPFLRIGRAPSDSTFLRIGRDPADKRFLRIGRLSSQGFLRFGRPSGKTFLRIGRPNKTFLRIGRASNNQKRFLRIGRAPSGQTFLRIGRSNEMINDDDLLHEEDLTATQMLTGEAVDTQGDLGKRAPGLRIGKRVMDSYNTKESSLGLTAEELQLLRENKDLLLAYLENNPDLFDGFGLSVHEDDDGYFAFPRQGRAMSFYFPRMGRSGVDDSNYCCAEGVRRVYTVGGETVDICARGQTCCQGFSERTKVYKDLVITECVVESGLDKIRDYIGEE